MKKQDGITLISLIITIIIMLILAGVALSMVMGDQSIVEQAITAKEETEAAQKDEEEAINILNSKIAAMTGKWEKEGNVISRGDVELHVGDTINYDETKGGTITGLTEVSWKVLGVENGCLTLVATSNIGEVEIKGFDGLITGLQKLKDACETYGKGTGAIGARTITIDDIDSITGYDPNNTGNGNKYGSGTEYEYGLLREVTTDGYGYYNESKNEWVTITKGDTATLTCNYYSYYPKTLTDSKTDTEIANEAVTDIYNELFASSNDYWLGSRFIRIFTQDYYENYGLRIVKDERIYRSYLVSNQREYSSESQIHGIRPVVIIQSNVELEKVGDNEWKIN